ncbi:MAG: NERD domain-containing protein [Thermoflexibacter sp.]|nr:NERD domain-containing protein [Thermoflexibacter sp.]
MNLFVIALVAIGLISIAILIFSHLKDQKLIRTVTSLDRGTWSERRMVLMLLKSGIPAQTIFHDLYLRNPDGKFAQIDIVVPTRVGIFVFEIKDYSGWIFGRGNQREWTRVLAYGREKYRFYNPIFQNKKHITDLKNQLPQFQNIPFYSVVVFFGDCEFRDVSMIPDEVFLIKHWEVVSVVNEILNSKPHAKYTDKRAVVNLLKQAVLNGENTLICQQHSRNIEEMRQRQGFR